MVIDRADRGTLQHRGQGSERWCCPCLNSVWIGYGVEIADHSVLCRRYLDKRTVLEPSVWLCAQSDQPKLCVVFIAIGYAFGSVVAKLCATGSRHPRWGGELGFQVECADEGDRLHVEWRAKGVTIALPPMVLDFGRGFVGLDPDGHRLRVYALGDYK